MEEQAKIEVIYTFRTQSQQIGTIEIKKSCTEKEFLACILEDLQESEIEELVKLSLSQLNAKKRSQGIPWLLKRNGKLYFNDEPKEQDRELVEFKDDFLRKKRSSK